MTSRMFTPQELEDLAVLETDPGDTDEDTGTMVISDEMVEHKRWSIRHRLVFRLKDQAEGEAYCVSYYVPATESQEQDPWNEADKVKARIVRRTTKMVDVWE